LYAQAAGKPAAAATSTSYVVYHRKTGTTEWAEYRVYGSAEEARKAAHNLHDKGWEVQVYSRTATTRVPARPKAGTLPQDHTVSLTKAGEVFRWMARQNDISFRYPTDGCYARAHLMIRRMQKNGFKPWKVWSFANGESLYVRTTNHPSGHVTWRYHVAPILRVRLQDGQQRWYVIDPSMFKAPVTIAAWRNAQKRPGGRYDPYVTITRLGVAPIDATKKRLPGTGYWAGPDPKEGTDLHAVRMMKLYKPHEGRLPPRTVAGARPAAQLNRFAMPVDNRRLRAA
jgi:hypothetical protein